MTAGNLAEADTEGDGPGPLQTSISIAPSTLDALRAACCREIASEAELQALLNDVAAAASLILGVERVSVWRYDSDREFIELQAFHGIADEEAGSRIPTRDHPRYFEAVRRERAVAASNALRDPRIADFRRYLARCNVSALIDAPIWVGGQFWGVLCIEHVGTEPRLWSREDQQGAAAIADFAALAVAAFQKSEAEARLAQVELRYRSLLEGTISGLFQLDEGGALVEANRTFLGMIGAPDLAAAADAARERSLPRFADGDRQAAFQAAMERNEDLHEFEAELLRMDGSSFPAVLSVITVLDALDGTPTRHGTVEDLSVRRRLTADQGLVDPLTRLPNRVQFRERLKAAQLRRQNDPRFGYGILCLDCDQLQEVNEWLGHSGGDALLAALAHRLSGTVRDQDLLARLRSDEFVLLVEGVGEPAVLAALAERLKASLVPPLKVMGHDVFQTVSIGIAWSGDADDADAVLRDASIAMHRAKESGRSKVLQFEPSMRHEAAQRLQLETDLRTAIERNEFVLEYQPIVRTRTGELLGFEALVRWEHPVRGRLQPAEFIQTAERSGLIVALDRWVLNAACRQMAEWRALGLEGITVSVNLSPVQFGQPDLVSVVDACLARHGIPGSAIKLELTETALLSEPAVVDSQLRALRSRGIAIMIDDFGTGYSSLSHLHRYPVDGLKIDKRFVANATRDRMSAAIVTAVVTLARALDLAIVAEGVEHPEQSEWLGDFPDLALQGYHFARPLPAERAGALISRMR